MGGGRIIYGIHVWKGYIVDNRTVHLLNLNFIQMYRCQSIYQFSQ